MNESNKQFHFIAGLPRSGSTLLCNILAQNPNFHSTATSGVMDIMFNIRNIWDNLLEFKANPNNEAKKRVLRGILENFYADIKKPIIFDKCRGWVSLIEMAEAVLDRKVKILVPVRDTRDVLASFEKIWRKESALGQFGGEGGNYFQFQTVEGRVDFWLRGDQPVGLALSRVRDAINRGYRDRLHFVSFEKLTTNPEETMKKIYAFLGEPYFEHNFDNVEQVTWEDDTVHGVKDLHTIRSKVEPMSPQWPKVLGPFAEKYSQFNIWEQI